MVAEDLSPSETIQMNKDNVLAFVTVKGSACSHTAILAGMMGIPALVRTELSPDASMDGQQGIVDGYEGVFYVEPEAELEKQMRNINLYDATTGERYFSSEKLSEWRKEFNF